MIADAPELLPSGATDPAAAKRANPSPALP
jgi:hypothetical protein